MSPPCNSFNKLLQSFNKVCLSLENKAENSLKQIAEECAEEYNSSAKLFTCFDQMISGISDTYSELLNTNDLLKLVTNRAMEKNVLSIPYEMQSPFVKCIKELYSGKVAANGMLENKIIDDKKLELLREIIEISEKNQDEIRNAEIAIQQVKDDIPS